MHVEGSRLPTTAMKGLPSIGRLSSRKTRGKRIWETPGKDPGDRERPPGGPGGRESPRDKERIMLHMFGDPLF